MMDIAPSILSVLHEDLNPIFKKLELAGIKYLHLDVMDNIFVPNYTFDDQQIKDFRKQTSLLFDTHLMIQNPSLVIDKYLDAGADLICFHLEAEKDPLLLIKKIKEKGVKVGMAIKPKTKVDALDSYLELLDLVLVMSVEPGFGGQTFQTEMLEKVKYLKEKREKFAYHYIIEIDGGINISTGRLAKEAGADLCVVGTFLFNNNFDETLKELKKL